MPYVRLEVSKIRLDKKGNLRRIDAETRRHFHAMLAAFLRAVVPKVPVWSGMARGSLIPLAQYLTNRAGFSVSVPILPDPDSESHQKAGQNVDAGIARGDFEFITREGIYTLRFGPKVEHYKYNEVMQSSLNLKHPTPWESFKAGREAALEYREYVKTHLPRIRLTVSKVTVGTSRGL